MADLDPFAANAHASPVTEYPPREADASDSAQAQVMKDDTLADVKSEEKNSEKSQQTPDADPLVTPEDADVKRDHDETIFPQQLMDMVEKETNEGTTVNGERVLEWLPAGDSFVIRDKKSLELEVLPKYFRTHCKTMSFVRKLYRQVIGISFTTSRFLVQQFEIALTHYQHMLRNLRGKICVQVGIPPCREVQVRNYGVHARQFRPRRKEALPRDAFGREEDARDEGLSIRPRRSHARLRQRAPRVRSEFPAAWYGSHGRCIVHDERIRTRRFLLPRHEQSVPPVGSVGDYLRGRIRGRPASPEDGARETATIDDNVHDDQRPRLVFRDHVQPTAEHGTE